VHFARAKKSVSKISSEERQKLKNPESSNKHTSRRSRREVKVEGRDARRPPPGSPSTLSLTRPRSERGRPRATRPPARPPPAGVASGGHRLGPAEQVMLLFFICSSETTPSPPPCKHLCTRSCSNKHTHTKEHVFGRRRPDSVVNDWANKVI
jgi:hypothetical protein